MLTLNDIYAKACCMVGLPFKNRVLDILGWPTPIGCSLHLNGTVVERQAHFKNDPSGTGGTRPGILENVGGSARDFPII